MPYNVLLKEAQNLVSRMPYEKLSHLVAFLKADELSEIDKKNNVSDLKTQKLELFETIWNTRKIVSEDFDIDKELEIALREKHGFIS